MRDAGQPVTHACGSQAQRVYTTPPIRFTPEGYYRSPDDPNYWTGLKDHETRPTWQQKQ